MNRPFAPRSGRGSMLWCRLRTGEPGYPDEEAVSELCDTAQGDLVISGRCTIALPVSGCARLCLSVSGNVVEFCCQQPSRPSLGATRPLPSKRAPAEFAGGRSRGKWKVEGPVESGGWKSLIAKVSVPATFNRVVSESNLWSQWLGKVPF